MSLVTLLDDSSGSIRESLSLEEIQIAFTFLKKRFPQYSLKEIVLSLNQYILQKEYSTADCTKQLFTKKKNSDRLPDIDNQFNFQSSSTNEYRIRKKEQIKLVAKLYCENGVKYSLIQYFYPNMTLKDYKYLLQTIMLQTLNNIQKFLKYQCNVLLDQIPKDLKRKVASKLFNIKQCLGRQSSVLIETFYKFIERFYIDQKIQIEYKEALSLFKLIQEFSKSLQQQTLKFQISKPKQTLLVAQSDCSAQEEKAIIILFKKHQNITKVSDSMCQKYGYNLKWSKHSIKHILRRILKVSLQKLIQSANKYDKQPDMFFSSSQQNLNILCENQNCFDIKQKLLDFYLQKSVTLLRIRELIKKANVFFVGQYSPQQFNFSDQAQIQLKLPQLKVDSQAQRQLQSIKKLKKEPQIIDLQSIRAEKSHNNQRKKRTWIQVMEVDSDSKSNHSELFYKQLETDIESTLIGEEKLLKRQNLSVRAERLYQKNLHAQKKLKIDEFNFEQSSDSIQIQVNSDNQKEWENISFEK